MTIPKTLCQGRFLVKQVLGWSERSTVYECFDPQADSRVAVKVLPVGGPNPDIAREMYRREVGALKGFEHPFVVQMLQYQPEEESGRLNIVLELVSGGKTLEDLIVGKEPALGALATTMRWRLEQALGLLAVLVRAHERGIIHRDVKPRNILVDREQQQLKLGDFGIARILENYGRGAGGETLRDFFTRPYAAPEQVLRNDTSYPADLYAFGVVLAALVAWKIPAVDFTADHLDAWLADVGPEHAIVVRHLEEVLRGLLITDPHRRPRAAEVEQALRVALEAVVEREPVRVIITNRARTKAQECGLKGSLLDDLNQCLAIVYEPERDGKPWSITCHGRLGRARLAPDHDQPNKLKMVDYFQPHPTEHARTREVASAAPFVLVEGEGSASNLVEFAYSDYQRSQAQRAEQSQVQEMLDVAHYILERQRERLASMTIRYVLPDADPQARAPAGAGRRVEGEFLTVCVTGVKLTVPHEPDRELDDPERISELVERLTDESSFAYGGRELGTAYHFDPQRRELTLRLSRATTVPARGELACEDAAQRTALDRQERALDTFKSGRAVDARLSRLLLHPEQNALDEREPVELIQEGLEPALDVADTVSRCLAARDFFMIQGPPGTGKTTLITEVMIQILRRDPYARILLTSQANEAVNNAVESLREQDRRLGEKWRIVRDQSSFRSREAPAAGFDYDFAEWARETIDRSARASATLPPELPPARRRQLEEALGNWRAKLAKVPDVKTDYAESVQVWAMTLLRVPSLYRRMRNVRFDAVIIDEAARATTSELLVALVTGERFILVGDHRQLPPFFDTETRADLAEAGVDVERASRSLFQDMFERISAENKTTLRRQFRMHRSIGKMIGDLYYPEVGLDTGVPDDARTLALARFGEGQRVFWLDVAEGRERRQAGSTSRWNLEEAVAVEALLADWERELTAAGCSYTVGVIAAYADQRARLIDRVRPTARRWQTLKIRIDTVDAFQGKQDDIIIYSMVRANTPDLGFIADRRRLNVAFSRAKRLLVVAGHRATALQNPEIAAFVRAIPHNNIITPGKKT